MEVFNSVCDVGVLGVVRFGDGFWRFLRALSFFLDQPVVLRTVGRTSHLCFCPSMTELQIGSVSLIHSFLFNKMTPKSRESHQYLDLDQTVNLAAAVIL